MPVDQISNFTFISSPHADYVQGQTAILFALYFNHPWSHFRLLTEQWEKGHILRLSLVKGHDVLQEKGSFPVLRFYLALCLSTAKRTHTKSDKEYCHTAREPRIGRWCLTKCINDSGWPDSWPGSTHVHKFSRTHACTHSYVIQQTWEFKKKTMQIRPSLKAITPDWNQIKFKA